MTSRPHTWRGPGLALLLAAAGLAATVPTLASDRDAAPVSVEAAGGHTRVLLDFTRMTAYRARGIGGDVVVTLDTAQPLSLSKTRTAEVEGFSIKIADGITTLTIDTPPGATFKDFRLARKVAIDIYPPAAAKEKEAKEKEVKSAAPIPPPARRAQLETPIQLAPPPKEEKKEEKKPDVKAAEKAPEKIPEKTPEKAEDPQVAEIARAIAEKLPAAPGEKAPPLKGDMQAATVAPATAGPATTAPASPVIVDTAPPETSPGVTPEAVAQEQLPPDPTTITVSTISPTRLAVFQRFNALWVVLDSEAAGAAAPTVSGPESGLLGNARTIKLPGGTAYRYDIPAGRFLAVEKENLLWRVRVSPVRMMTGSGITPNFVVDDASGHARMMAEVKDGSALLELKDPVAGDTLEIVASGDTTQRIAQRRRVAELELLPAAIGVVARPWSDQLKFNRIENFLLVSGPAGLSATPGATARPSTVAAGGLKREEPRLFDFPNWRQGGPEKLYRNARELENKIAAADNAQDRNALLMRLALLYFANNFGHEAVGVLRIVEDETPDMAKNPNFIALRGAAEAMAGHYAEAMQDLSLPAIQQHGEVSMWMGYAAAASEQWHKANRAFPSDNTLLLQYPEDIAVPFTLYMAESALRLGKTDTATALLASLDSMQDGFGPPSRAALNYLKGEAARQNGDAATAIRLWKPVASGIDRLYHTKASLALANLRLAEKQITVKTAIEDVDSLRFAWRGDGLEVQILQNLGQLKIQDGKYLSGLEDLRAAAALADSLLDDSDPIRANISRAFSDLFVGGKARDLQPLEAVSIYNSFQEYMPPGEEGAVAALGFADSLIGIDLLEKAEALLETQLKSGYVPEAKLPATQNKLAAVYLLDSAPEKALATLDAAGAGYDDIAEERVLLRARALSQMGKTEDAIGTLSQSTSRQARKLKADVLWRARRWRDAAETIESMLPVPGKTLSEDDAQMVVNAAVGYKLAGDGPRVADLKTRYGQEMDSTTLGSTFGVVTRTGGSSRLADRDTILKIADEVDMFKGFLDAYKAGGKGS